MTTNIIGRVKRTSRKKLAAVAGPKRAKEPNRRTNVSYCIVPTRRKARSRCAGKTKQKPLHVLVMVKVYGDGHVRPASAHSAISARVVIKGRSRNPLLFGEEERPREEGAEGGGREGGRHVLQHCRVPLPPPRRLPCLPHPTRSPGKSCWLDITA